MISVRYFAGLRERLGRKEDRIPAEGVSCAADAWAAANGGEPPPASVLMAVNKQYGNAQSAVKDGDEVAFFPPVTGG